MQYIQWPKMPPVNRKGWRPSCSHATLRAIRYRALLHGWAFCPYFSILPISPSESEAPYVLDGLFDQIDVDPCAEMVSA